MKKVNKILFVSIIAVTVLMYGSALIAVWMGNANSIWVNSSSFCLVLAGMLAFTATGSAMAGLVISLVTFFVALASLTSPTRRKDGLLYPVLAFLASLAFIMCVFVIPLMETAKSGRPSPCRYNLKQIVLGVKMYANDHGEAYPPSFSDLMAGNYIKAGDRGIFVESGSGHRPGSPGDVHGWTDYAYVSGLSEEAPAECVMAFCMPINHHDQGGYVAFVGGVVQWFPCHPTPDTVQGYPQPTFQELTNTPSLFYGTTDEVQLADLKKRTRIIWPKRKP